MIIQQIKIPMLDGSSKEKDALTFSIKSKSGAVVPLAVRQINDRLCYILDYRTGLKISSEHTGDREEAAEGFTIAVDIGVFDLDEIYAVAMKSPAINETPTQLSAQVYGTELTATGEQTVIPGCERNLSPKITQLDLFGGVMS